MSFHLFMNLSALPLQPSCFDNLPPRLLSSSFLQTNQLPCSSFPFTSSVTSMPCSEACSKPSQVWARQPLFHLLGLNLCNLAITISITSLLPQEAYIFIHTVQYILVDIPDPRPHNHFFLPFDLLVAIIVLVPKWGRHCSLQCYFSLLSSAQTYENLLWHVILNIFSV